MAAGPQVTVSFVADTTGVEQAGRGVSGTMQGLKGLAAAAGGAFAAVQIGQFAKDAVNAASDLNESASKVTTVFGQSGKAMVDWSKTAATSIGLSQREALDAAGAFGNMFTQVGLSTDQAAQMSTTMSGLAADFASFHNADITDVLDAQQAAFRGEYDAVQKFVPTINAAAVQQRAMADTGKTNADQLTASEKAMAAYSLMVEGAGAAQGDFERTSDGMANQQRILSAEWENAQATLGQALLPILTDFAGILAEDVVPALASTAEFVKDNTSWLGPLAAALAAVIVVVKALAIAQALLNTAILSFPVIAIIAGIAALAAGLLWAYNNVQWFHDAVQAVWNWLKENWQLLLAIIAGPIGGAVVLIINHWDKLKAAAAVLWSVLQAVFAAIVAAFNWLVDAAQSVWAFVSGVWSAMAAAAGVVGSAIQSAFSAVASWLSGVFTSLVSGAMAAVKAAWNGLVSAAQNAASWVQSAFQGVVGFFSGMVSAISGVVSGVYDAIVGPFKRALDWLADVPGKIKNIISSIPSIPSAIGGVLGGLNPFSAVAPPPHATALWPGAAGARGFMPTATGMGAGGWLQGGRSTSGRSMALGMGGNVYEITVEVAPNVSPAEVGRQLVDSIRAFEAAAGRGWRA